jgi:hypothetical protein
MDLRKYDYKTKKRGKMKKNTLAILVAIALLPMASFADKTELGKMIFSNDVTVAGALDAQTSIKLGTNAPITNWPAGGGTGGSGSQTPLTNIVDAATYGVTNASVFGFTNSVVMKSGALNGTNGVYWTSKGTNYWITFP